MNIKRIIKEELFNEAKIKVGKDEYEKLFEDKTIMALKPLTHQASCKYGSGTQWCVTMRSDDQWWKRYTKKTSSFAGTNWYNIAGVEEEIKRTWLDKLLGRPGTVVKKEIQNFMEEFPIGILYFVILKKRIVSHEWDEELKYNKPIYEVADPKDPMNKLALLYKPDRADFGDMSHWKSEGDFYDFISHKLDSAHNNMSIFNALDEKVTLSKVREVLGDQFRAPFAFIEEDFQKERDRIDHILRNVLDKVYPLAGAEGSEDPKTWMTSKGGDLVSSRTGNMSKTKDGTLMRNAQTYKGGAW